MRECVDMRAQESLFSGSGVAPPTSRLDLPDADIEFWPDFLPSPARDRLLADLDETTAWRQETIQMYGKSIPVPRLTAWYGDPGTSYTYSKITMDPEPWTPPLSEIKTAVEVETGATFNSVLLNLYRDGGDSVAWHSDDEAELGPVIASVSFGDTRTFQLRHASRPDLRLDVPLTHGSLLVMRGPTQLHWQHQVPKTSRRVGPRINLTFRHVTAPTAPRPGGP